LKEAVNRYKWVIAVFVVFALVVFFFQKTLRVSAYLGLFSGSDPLHTLKNDFVNHLADWAAIFLNFSYSKFTIGSASLVTVIYFIAGLLFFVVVACLFVKSSKAIAMPVKLYLVFYCIVIFLWPYFDPRFWVPIVPLLIAILMQAVELIPKGRRFIVTSYCIYYTIAGLGAMGYYSYTSLNKRALSVKQDASIWQNEYEQFFFGKPITHPDAKAREKIIHILERYD
jgi:hypothetical protein